MYEDQNEDEKIFLTSKSLSGQPHLRSELAQEILSRQPGFLENWSLVIFMGLLLLMLGATWFVHYPDIINTHAILTAENAPKEIIVRQEGRLIKLFVKNNEELKKNDTIGWIESTASHKEIIALSQQLDNTVYLLRNGHPQDVFKLFNKYFNNLGEIQPAYQQFINAKQLFSDYASNGFYQRRMSSLEDDVLSLNNLNLNLLKQKDLTEQDVDLAKETFNINKQLLDKKVITEDEYRTEKSKYVNKEKNIPQLEASLYTNEMQKRDKLKEIQQLGHDMDQQKTIFQQELQSLKSQIDDWMRKYLLLAPIDGRVSFTTSLQENRYLKSGLVLGYINPEVSNYYAETILPQNNFGKLDTGLRIQLRFDAYPYEEWGFIDGTLNYISNVPTDSGFLATIRLDKGLITNNNKQLHYKSGLKAQAIIITKDMRLLERFYYSFIKSTSIESK